MLLLLDRQLPAHIADNRQNQTVIVIQEPLALPLVGAKQRLPGFRQERLDLVAQPAQAGHDGLVVAARVGAERQDAVQQLAEALRDDVRRGGGGLGGCGGDGARGEGGREGADGVAVRVHDALQARPEGHGRAVDVAVRGGDAAALQFEGEVLVQADAEEHAQAVVGVGCELAREGLAEGEGGFEDVVEVARDGGEGEGGAEKSREEGVLSRGVVDEGEVEVAEGDFEVVGGLVFFGEVRRDGELVAGAENFYPPAQVESIVRGASDFGA